MSATAIRSGELLAFPSSARRGAPVATASVVSFRMRAPTAGRVAVRVVAAAEGAGAGAGAEADGKPKPKKRAASGIMKPKPISPELREFVGGAAELPRTEALKIIWAHIKGNNLQSFTGCRLAVYKSAHLDLKQKLYARSYSAFLSDTETQVQLHGHGAPDPRYRPTMENKHYDCFKFTTT